MSSRNRGKEILLLGTIILIGFTCYGIHDYNAKNKASQIHIPIPGTVPLSLIMSVPPGRSTPAAALCEYLSSLRYYQQDRFYDITTVECRKSLRERFNSTPQDELFESYTAMAKAIVNEGDMEVTWSRISSDAVEAKLQTPVDRKFGNFLLFTLRKVNGGWKVDYFVAAVG